MVHAAVLSVLLAAMHTPGAKEVRIIYKKRSATDSVVTDIDPSVVKPVEWTTGGCCVMFVAWHVGVKKRFHVEDVISAHTVED